MEQLLEGLQAKPFAECLGLSPSRFSQKLYKKVVNGYTQDFTETERHKMKNFALFLAQKIVHDVEKI